jgi:LysM repeat protein
LGSHKKQTRIRIPHRLPTAAGPALAGVAGVTAAFCLAPQALADPPAAQGAAATSAAQGAVHHAMVADASRLAPQSARLLSAMEQTAQHKAASGPSWYTVKEGDSLSTIAGRAYHNQDAWPVLYWANRGKIHWANVIEPGQVLRVPVKPTRIPDPPGALGPAPAPAAQVSAPASATAPGAAQVSYAGGSPGGSFGQCVIARESGGNAQVMNATGHYGLYQFSASTWAAYGGSPADFGQASVAEQNQVFANALARGGQSNWSAYDGC